MANVVVIGGGPGGAVAAGFLQKAGHKVTLIERQKLPRDHVGESLLTSFPEIIERLGHKYTEMLDRRVQFDGTPLEVQPKLGARVALSANLGEALPNNFGGDKGRKLRSDGRVPDELIVTELGWGDKRRWAWQTRRDHMDKFLVDIAADLGARVWLETSATKVDFERREVHYQYLGKEEGKETTGTIRFDYLVDCSGFAKLTHPQVIGEEGTKYFKSMDNFGMTSWWKNTKVMADPELRKYITVDLIQGDTPGKPYGWCWFIPVNDQYLSVGTVMNRDLSNRLRAGRTHAELHAEMLRRTVFGFDHLIGPDGEEVTKLQVMPDRSHRTPFSCDMSKRVFYAGDTAAFLDPFLSTGMHMACWAGMNTAMSINSHHRGLLSDKEVEEYHSRIIYRQFGRLQAIVSSVLIRAGHYGCTYENVRRDLTVEGWDDVCELLLPYMGIKSIAEASDAQFKWLVDTVYLSWRSYCQDAKVQQNVVPRYAAAVTDPSDRMYRDPARPNSGSRPLSWLFALGAGLFVGAFTEFFGDEWQMNHIGFYSMCTKSLTVRKMSRPVRAFHGMNKFFTKYLVIPIGVLVFSVLGHFLPYRLYYRHSNYGSYTFQKLFIGLALAATVGSSVYFLKNKK